MDILESLLNSSSHAIFALDRDGIVTHINRRAKEQFGLYNHSQQSHAAGRLEKGDLVILATTAMGAGDGSRLHVFYIGGKSAAFGSAGGCGTRGSRGRLCTDDAAGCGAWIGTPETAANRMERSDRLLASPDKGF